MRQETYKLLDQEWASCCSIDNGWSQLSRHMLGTRGPAPFDCNAKALRRQTSTCDGILRELEGKHPPCLGCWKPS